MHTGLEYLLPLIIFSSLLAGIVVVASLLILHLTVAMGTINGIIFYANIVAANRDQILSFYELYHGI